MEGGRGIPTVLPSPTAEFINVSAAQEAFTRHRPGARIRVNSGVNVNKIGSLPFKNSQGNWGKGYRSVTSW